MSFNQLFPSLCVLCTDPGRCCRTFTVGNLFALGTTPEMLRAWLVKRGYASFMPVGERGYPAAEDPTKERWAFSCNALDPKTGRCKIYDRRPDICREYVPGRDQLCTFGGKNAEHIGIRL